jgi:gas vesicle protein
MRRQKTEIEGLVGDIRKEVQKETQKLKQEIEDLQFRVTRLERNAPGSKTPFV